jgi:cobalt-zinc-cadmium efflux system outer membrane protein
MSRVSWASTVLLAAAGSMPIQAQILTEQQFLDGALTDHPGIAAAEADVAAASGVRRQAGIIGNPELIWEREDPADVARQDTWRIFWRLPFDGRKHRVAAAEAAVDASNSTLVDARLRNRLEMRAIFASWYVAVQREAFLDANLDRTRVLAERLRARAEEGEASGVEAMRLDLEVEVLEREAGTARAEARAWRAAAASWSALVTGDVVPARPALPPPPTSIDLSDRADIEALEHLVVAAEAHSRLERRVLAPPVVSAGWIGIEDGVQSFDGPVLGVAWPLPIFNRNQGARQAAEAEVSRAGFELAAAKKRALQQSHAALASYTELHRVVVRGAAGGSEFDVVDGMLAAFEAGEASLTDVLDALRATVDVRLVRLETYARALAAERDLEAALGRPVISGGRS